MATIKEVAKAAGVSVATVSRMMNKPDVVQAQTAKRIRKAMLDLDYHPNALARALQIHRSGIIGMIVPRISYELFARIAAAAEDSLSSRGYRLMICHSEYEEQREMDMVSLLKSHKVDGLLVCSYVGNPEKYSRLDFPIVSIDREMEHIPSVTCDNRAGGALAARTLWDRGCRHPLIIAYPVPGFMPLWGRLTAFSDFFAGRGASCSRLEIEDPARGAAPLMEALRRFPEIDGFFVNSDHLAASLISQMRRAGCDLMDRLPLVSFDGLDASGLLDITTIAQPVEDLGRCAVDILLNRIEGRQVPIRSTLEVACISRGSTENRSAGNAAAAPEEE